MGRANPVKYIYTAYSTVYILANDLNANMSPLRIRFPASQFRGLSAFGAASNAIIALQMVPIPQAGDQSDFKTSKHISPVLESTLGWNVRVLKKASGATSGYSPGSSISI